MNKNFVSQHHSDDHTNEDCMLIKMQSRDIWSNTERIFCFWISRKLNSAITQLKIHSLDGKLVQEVKNTDFFLLPGKQIYLPKKTEVLNYTYCTIPNDISPTPIFTDEFVLVEASTKKINEKQFDLRTKYSAPGTHIGDRTLTDTESGVQYVIPANPADLDRVIEAALTGGTFTPTPMASTGAVVVRWLLCIAGIAMILYAGYMKFVNRKT